MASRAMRLLLLAMMVLGLIMLLASLTMLRVAKSVVVQEDGQVSPPTTLNNNKAGISVRGRKLKVAYAITVTKDGPYLDGAAVLKHSIDRLPSKHDVDMVAIVHPKVQTTRAALKKLGINVFEFPPPITSAEIEGEYLRKEIDKSGCCGALELLKLRAYQLTQYDRVVLLDMDVLVVKSIDHLFEKDKEIVFTYDYAMDGGGAAPPVQGGFLLIRPNEQAFQAMIDVVREGDFRPGTGWAGSKIGWCWGGQTVQGLVSYYYNRIEPTKFEEVDPCTYNAMVSIKRCEKTPMEDVYSIHYTVCQKPVSFFLFFLV